MNLYDDHETQPLEVALGNLLQYVHRIGALTNEGRNVAKCLFQLYAETGRIPCDHVSMSDWSGIVVIRRSYGNEERIPLLFKRERDEVLVTGFRMNQDAVLRVPMSEMDRVSLEGPSTHLKPAKFRRCLAMTIQQGRDGLWDKALEYQYGDDA